MCVCVQANIEFNMVQIIWVIGLLALFFFFLVVNFGVKFIMKYFFFLLLVPVISSFYWLQMRQKYFICIIYGVGGWSQLDGDQSITHFLAVFAAVSFCRFGV